MVLDMRTIVFITMIFNFIFGVGMLIGLNNKKSFKGLEIISLGFFFTAFGFLLMFLRDYISPFLSVVVCNTSILFGVILSCWGLFMFYHKTIYSHIYDIVGLVIFFILFTYYLLFNPIVNARIIIICIYLLYYYGASLYAIIYKPVFKKTKANWFMGIFLVTIIVYYLFRTVYTIRSSYIDSFMDAGLVHSIAIIFFAIWSVVICFGIFIVMNAVTHEDLEKDVYFDSLTGLYNRRAINDETFRYNFTGNISNQCFAYVLCDIDDFKIINDTYGHIFGDYVLTEVSDVLRQITRKDDFISRFGGDEFFLFLNISDAQTLEMICKKIRNKMIHTSFRKENITANVSISIGAYITNDKDVKVDYALMKADQALYLSKENGKNRVEIINES